MTLYRDQASLDGGTTFEFKIGSGTGIRTLNLAVNSRLLYRLSYPGSTIEF